MSAASQFDQQFKAFMRRVLSQEPVDGLFKLSFGRDHYKVEHSEPLPIPPLVLTTRDDGSEFKKLPSFSPEQEATLKAIYTNLKSESEVKKAVKQQPNIAYAAQVYAKKTRIQTHQRSVFVVSSQVGIQRANALRLDNPILTQMLNLTTPVDSTLVVSNDKIQQLAFEQFPTVPIASAKRVKKVKEFKELDQDEKLEEDETASTPEEDDVPRLAQSSDSLETNKISETGGMRLK